MHSDRRLVWSEGMFLSPHHFQQWDDYRDRQLADRLNSLDPFPWGLSELEVNLEGLANGNFSILKCRGVFPGGTSFVVPDGDAPAPGRVLRECLDPSVQTVEVFLGLPTRRDSAANLAADGTNGEQPRRYRQGSVRVLDENTGDNEREIAVAGKNLAVLLGGESLAGYDHLQVARLRQEAEGSFALDEAYVPPCLRVECSDVLIRMVRRMLETLHAKSTSLSESRSQRTTGLLEFSSADLGNFWLLHTVNSFIPVLNHFFRVPRSHPERLFTALASFAGALTTFSPSGHPKDLPGYDHGDLGRTFGGLEDAVQELLKAVVPTGAVEIPLERASESKFRADVVDDQVLGDSQLFLAAGADVPEHQLIEELPKQAKISSAEQSMALMGLALPGVALTHQPAPPAPLRVQLGLQYFRFETRGDAESRKHWEEICRARNIVIRVPGQRFPNLKLQLWSIKD
jgi:type VI secretion system protein ImpJ